MQKPNTVSPRLLFRLQTEARRLWLSYILEFPAFLDEARSVSPELAKEPRFAFVAYRIFREHCGELPSNWQDEFPALYRDFVARFTWGVAGAPAWMTQNLIDETLSVWQKHFPLRLKATDAVEMLGSVGMLHEAGVWS